MTEVMNNKRQSRTILTHEIERYARKHDLSFLQAGRIVCRDGRYFELVVDSLGGWYRGQPPSDQTIWRLKNEDLVFLAKRWPDGDLKGFTKDELYNELLPYLPRSKKSPPKSGCYAVLRQKAEDHFARGYDRKEIVNMLGISNATVYRWFPKVKA